MNEETATGNVNDADIEKPNSQIPETELADMELKEELRQAVALFYDGDQAPTVTAKGEGAAAEEIITIARENGITLCENKALLELLMTLELGDNIPENLYVAIAQIISFAYQLQGKTPDNIPKHQSAI